MTIQPGSRLGAYQIVAQLGAGGMGEVYLAEDPRLRRRVAVKTLPGSHTLDPVRRTRFLTEARAASALQHPNIVTIFDLGSDDGVDFLVMEFVEGRSLRELLSKRRLEIREAVGIAAEMASALAAAHGKGIVHRDIKPENVMIDQAGTAKILDYGVAKLVEATDPDAPTSEALSVTSPGAIVGTIAYMSPEQVQGEPLDHRTDIFSLGVVMMEMLTGRNPFAAPSLTGVVQRIVGTPPEQAITSEVCAPLRDLLLRVLARKPGDRYQSARDLELDLRNVHLSGSQSDSKVAAPQQHSRARWLVPVGACLLSATAAIFLDRLFVQKRDGLERIHFASLTSDPGYEGEPTFSADGQTIAYVSDRTGNFDIFLKQVAGGPEINLTSDESDDVQPAFSPDGKQIAFVSTRTSVTPLLYRNPSIDAMGGDIWVMPALGGRPRRIVENGNFPAWSSDGTSILFVRGPWSGQKIFRVPASGGVASEVPIQLETKPLFLTTPRASPDGTKISFSTHQPNHVVVTGRNGGTATFIAEGRHAVWTPDSKALVYSDLAPGQNATLSRISIDEALVPGASSPVTSGRGEDRNPSLSPDGSTVVYASQDVSFNIERLPFDPEGGKPAGVPEPVTRGGDFSPFFSVSPDGHSIVFQSQKGMRNTLWRQDIEAGVVVQLAADEEAGYSMPEWSPDGTRIAYSRVGTGGRGSTWVMRSDGASPVLVSDTSGFVNWFPDSRSIAYWDTERRDVRLKNLESGAVRIVANEGTIRTLHKFSSDGKWMIYQAIGELGVTEVRVVEIGNLKSRLLVRSAHENGHPFFSHDLRWVYYQPDHKNIYRLPGPAQGWREAPPQQVTFFPESDLYIEQPQHSRDGRYLYYSRRNGASDLWIGRYSREK